MSSRKGFSRSDRIRSSADFLRVKREGRSVRCGRFLVANTAGPAKWLGLVASRATGCAVERNRLKRVVREFFRLNRELFPDGDTVIVALAGAGGIENCMIRDSIMTALAKLKTK